MRSGFTLALTLAAMLAGCADETGGDDGAAGEDLDGDAPRWSAIHYRFARGCISIGCHSSSTTGAAAGGLDMAVGIDAHRNLLAEAKACAGRRVEPGDPEASVLLKKISGKSGDCGSGMTLRGTKLPPDFVDDVRRWIAAGAPNDMPVLDGVNEDPPAGTPTFTEVYERVFRPHCGGAWCHAPWQSPDETRYSVATASNAYYDQINVPAVCQGIGSKYRRIKPGAPEESLTLLKLQRKGCPNGMPVNQLTYAFMPLDQELIDLVRDWIAAGAPYN